MSAIVGFDLTDEDSAEEEGKGHYYHANDQAGGREEVGAVVGVEFFGVFVYNLGE